MKNKAGDVVLQIWTAYYLPLKRSEEDIVAQHRHMTQVGAVSQLGPHTKTHAVTRLEEELDLPLVADPPVIPQ